MLNIKRIFETIADAGQKILEKKSLKKFSKKRDLIELCDDLLSSKGAAFGITLARDILFRYHNLSHEDKLKFLLQVNEKYKPDTANIDNAIKDYTENKNSRSILNLSRITSGTRKELFVRLNMAPKYAAFPNSFGEEPPSCRATGFSLISNSSSFFLSPLSIASETIISV